MDCKCKSCGRKITWFWFRKTGVCANCERFPRTKTSEDLTESNEAYKVRSKEANG